MEEFGSAVVKGMGRNYGWERGNGTGWG